MRIKPKLLIQIIILISLAVTGKLSTQFKHQNEPVHTASVADTVSQTDSLPDTDMKLFQEAYDNQRSNFQVKQSAKIIKVLKDDNDGLKHQRFLVELASGQKLLIAHNIELAPRVENPQPGKTITFNGEYEWNNKGGVVHWTHHDPNRSHPAGWLRYQGKQYQ